MKTCKNLSKRGLALFLALVMCLSMVQITAFAVDGHVHNEDGWSCTQDDSVRELSCDKHVHNESCYQTVQGELTCEAEEHQHGDGCYEAAEPQLTCADAEHTHGDSCYTQGEDVLTCAETEHTHGEDCYAAETVKVCEEEDHQHGDESYTVTEGEWTCTAPVVEETPAEVQAFLDAAAELPDASEVTAENAEEIGEQVSAVLDLYEAIGTETAEVTKALEAVYAVYAAVEAALELEDDSPFDVVTKTDNVTKTAYSQFNPYTSTSNTVSGGFAEDGHGTVVLTDENPTAVDVAFCHYWGAHIAGWPNGFQMIAIEQNTNSKVATAKARSSENGLIVEFEKGTQPGTTTICVGFTVTTLRPTANIASSGQTYAGFSGYLYYNVTNNGDGTTVEPVKPEAPTVSDVPATNQNGYVYVKCVSYPYANPLYNSTSTHAGFMSLRNSADGWSFGEVYANDGRFGEDAPANDYPWLCDLTIDKEWYLARWNMNYAGTKGGTHYLSDDEPVSMTFVSNGSEWYYFTQDVPLTVWTTHQKPDHSDTTYTVVYTDGVNGEVFGNESHSNLKEGDATPAFTGSTEREGYTFMGWAPTVNSVVSAEDANENGEIIYTATWTKDNTPPAPETIEVPVTIKVRFVGLDANTFNTKHDSGETATHPNEFYLTTPAHGADNESLGLSGQWNTLNSHGDGTESGTTYVPYVTFGPEDDYGNWAVETGKEYTAYFDLSNYTVDGYTYVSANGVANASSVELKFQADNTNPQELVITLVYKKDIEPTTPDAPTHQDVRDLIGAPVTVVCDTENVSNNTFGYTGDKTDRVTIGKVEGDATSGYTCNVTFIAQKFCDAFSSVRKVAHELADSQGDVTLTFTWDAENNTWKLPADFTAPVTIHVVCDNAKNIPYILHYKANPGEEAEVENLPASETKYGTAPGAVDFIVSSQVPTRDGYTFAGWEVEDKLLHGGDTFTMKGSQYAVQVEQTLWATWTKNTDPGPGPGPGVEPNKDGLKLTKAVDNSNPELGGTVTYTITVSNKTRVALKDLKIKDVMPEGVTLVEGSGKVTVNGAARTVSLTQDGQTCSWTVDGVIPVDGEVILTYNATVPGAAAEQITLTNTAQAFANQNEAPAPQMAQGVAQYAASMANDFVSSSASTEVNVKGYGFTSNEADATVTVKPGSGTNPGPVKPGKPDDGDLNKLKLGVQVVCDVENSNHSVTEYLLKTAQCTISEVTENADTATKEEYPYTCTVQLAASGQNWYLGQTIRGTKDYWNKEHQLADEEKILTATLYHDGEKWTLPIGGGMNPDVAQGTNIKAWKYLVIHTVHKAEQLPGAKDTTYTVVHEYYTNGALTGSNQDTMNGKVGQTVNAENITKVTTYGGNSYTYTSASPESLVLADSENTITLRYDRTTGGNGGGNGGGTTRYTLTVRYEYEDGTQAAPTHTERLARGDAYSVDSPVIEGYTPDQAVVSGEMPGRSLTVTVVYTPEGQDIPDEEPPLVDLPDEEPPLVNIPEEEPPLVEIPEEEPPLAETPLDPTPKTGDNSRTGLWAALCGFSLFGMLALLGKKREDEEA